LIPAPFGIPGEKQWLAIEEVPLGWSADKKYKVTGERGEALLLRLSDACFYEQKQAEYETIRRFAALGFPQSRPVAFGLCEDGRSVYMLLSWVEGQGMEQALPEMPVKRQYALGQEAGRILKGYHSLLVDRQPASRKERKLKQLAAYEGCSLRVSGDEAVIGFVRAHIRYVEVLPPCYLHGDFHPGNLVLTPQGQVGVIDFNRWKVGDPCEEFVKLGLFSQEVSPAFCRGQIEGYFGGEPPLAFWQALAVYAAHTALYSILWAQPYGQEDIAGMVRRYHRTMGDYDGFKTLVPAWYRV
jgi:aminoglycoside phosphotransferase (APT) family kinase protein